MLRQVVAVVSAWGLLCAASGVGAQTTAASAGAGGTGGAKEQSLLARQGEALDLIKKFADSECGAAAQLQGKSSSVEISGAAKAELAKVLKRIAELNLQGGATFKESEYQGFLQKDLPAALQSERSCRAEVRRALIRLVPGLS